jgi:hypothetical protein
MYIYILLYNMEPEQIDTCECDDPHTTKATRAAISTQSSAISPGPSVKGGITQLDGMLQENVENAKASRELDLKAAAIAKSDADTDAANTKAIAAAAKKLAMEKTEKLEIVQKQNISATRQAATEATELAKAKLVKAEETNRKAAAAAAKAMAEAKKAAAEKAMAEAKKSATVDPTSEPTSCHFKNVAIGDTLFDISCPLRDKKCDIGDGECTFTKVSVNVEELATKTMW